MVQNTQNLEARLEKPWPKWLLTKPQRWHIASYLGAGITFTAVAGQFIAAGTPPGTYVAPFFIILGIPMYFRAAQFYNYFYGK